MKHALKPTLAAMLLVPALGLAFAAPAAAQASGTTGSSAGTAPRANRADMTSAVQHAQMMRGGAHAMSSTPAMGTSSSARSDTMHMGATRSMAPPMAHTGSSMGMASANESDPKMYVFDALDTNHDGKLRREEISHDPKLARDMRSLDRNHDGTLTREEFAAYQPGGYTQQASYKARSTKHASH